MASNDVGRFGGESVEGSGSKRSMATANEIDRKGKGGNLVVRSHDESKGDGAGG